MLFAVMRQQKSDSDKSKQEAQIKVEWTLDLMLGHFQLKVKAKVEGHIIKTVHTGPTNQVVDKNLNIL